MYDADVVAVFGPAAFTVAESLWRPSVPAPETSLRDFLQVPVPLRDTLGLKVRIRVTLDAIYEELLNVL